MVCWHVVCGERAVFDNQWAPRLGVFWAGIKRSCVRATLEKSPLALEDARGLRCRAEVNCARLRQVADCSDLPPGCSGLGQMLELAIVGLFSQRRFVPPSSQLDALQKSPAYGRRMCRLTGPSAWSS